MNKENAKFEMDLTINKLVAAFEHINNSMDSHGDEIKNLLIQYNHKDLYDMGLMLSEVHVIDCIGKNQLINATFISKELNMTKGAISKITSKLLKKELIKGNHLENNKKEIYYTLTTRGKEVFKVHEILHKIESEKFVKILSKYDKEELSIISSFLDDLISEL
ncbi:MarR family transcriptional regulator [Clostridium beijerinckii]|uniref:DNA-binding MarR family transcriptional regulator n=1 Tax=Clostridium beijerinckii TaxID=1520 RepID=A0AAX0B6P3_CLOBE|nr:MarR family transcriptional regulator [Clostridium beijerinckii]NRT90288.1 DNA-binding MarR family transcriptional regulator [Clostridium beijerinckii]NYC69817.1 DNA-binding MarR family transcriptional regulator [Clostridium beijerinckii]